MKTRTSTAGKARSNQGGFTYVMVLVAVIVLGIVLEVGTVLTSHELQVEREAELLFRGQAYRQAIKSFYQSSGKFPRTLEDLRVDPRMSNKHHIRALYRDPMSTVGPPGNHWTLIRSQDNGIAGVASTSTRQPIKLTGFPQELEKFENAKSYAEWVFEYVPTAALNPYAPGHSPGTNPNAITPPVLHTN